MANSGTTTLDPPATEGQPEVSKRLREQTATVREDVRELGKLAREASHDKYEQAKHKASDYLENSRQKVHEVEDSVLTYVKEKPVKSLCIAAGAGALLGFLLSRR